MHLAPVILCFIAPLTVAIKLDLAGGLFLAEIVIPCVAAIVAFRRRGSSADKLMFLVVKLGLVYLAALIFSDIWNGSSFDQLSRGWARLCVFLLNLVSIYLLLDNQRIRLIAFTMGLVAGRVLLTYLSLDENLLNWKLGFAKPAALTLILFCVGLYRYRRNLGKLSPIFLFCLGIYNLLMDFRSLAAVLIATAVVLLASDFRKSQNRRERQFSTQSFAAMIGCFIVASFGTYEIYVYAAKSDWLGERAAGKFKSQVEGTDLPLLVAGRNELLVSIEAILDAPLLGHGSWPENRYYAEKISHLRYHYRLSDGRPDPTSDLIPMHSHLFGGWIEAGLAGGVFWALALYLIGRSTTRSYLGRSSMRPLYVYCSLLLAWDILFSPFSGFRRLETAYLLVVSARGLLERRKITKRLMSRKYGINLRKSDARKAITRRFRSLKAEQVSTRGNSAREDQGTPSRQRSRHVHQGEFKAR